MTNLVFETPDNRRSRCAELLRRLSDRIVLTMDWPDILLRNIFTMKATFWHSIMLSQNVAYPFVADAVL